MKYLQFSLILLLIGLGSTVLAEETPETAKISLQASQDVAAKACPKPIWHNPKVVWKGVTDQRAKKAVGMQTKRGKDPIQILADPALTQVFDQALKNLLQTCGLKFVDKGDHNTPTLDVVIDEFSAGVEKKLVTGKATANSKVTLTVHNGMQTSEVTLGSQIESKGLRKGKLKKIKKTLEELLHDTLLNIATSETFIEMLK